MPQKMEVTCEDPDVVIPEVLNCPTCAIELQPYRDLQPPYHLRRCPACQLVATWPRLPLGELRQQYESEYEQSTFHPFPLYLRRRRQVLARIMRHESQGTMLDIGCAGGHFLAYARDHGWQVTGVELNRQMAEYARRNFQLEVHALSVDDLPGRCADGASTSSTCRMSWSTYLNPMAPCGRFGISWPQAGSWFSAFPICTLYCFAFWESTTSNFIRTFICSTSTDGRWPTC
jgi:SAM-dependent methyltransferase